MANITPGSSTYDVTNDDLQVRYDYDGGTSVVYIGRAVAGTASSEAKWQIKKLAYSGTDCTSILFADGTNQYIKIWSSRATYDYDPDS